MGIPQNQYILRIVSTDIFCSEVLDQTFCQIIDPDALARALHQFKTINDQVHICPVSNTCVKLCCIFLLCTASFEYDCNGLQDDLQIQRQ